MHKSESFPAQQRGVSRLGLLILGLFVASFLTLGLKLGPLYLDYNVLTTVADELVADGSADRMSRDDIRQRFAAALRLNSIYDFDLADIQIARSGGRTTIEIAYERRLPLIANLDIVAAFNYAVP